MDTETQASIAAVVVASAALVIAAAQVLQQYINSGPLIRLCDSYVFGPLPGGGRRVWSLRQFRFRVIYSIPHVKLPSDWWPTEDEGSLPIRRTTQQLPWFDDSANRSSRSVETLVVDRPMQRQWSLLARSQANRLLRPAWLLDVLSRFRRLFEPESPTDEAHDPIMNEMSTVHDPTRIELVDHTWEACWVALSRIAQLKCRLRLNFTFAKGDADRCPADLQVVPMLISLRDVTCLCFMYGMELVGFDATNGTLQMKGTCGLLTSSSHPLLGVIVRFSPLESYLEMPEAYSTEGGYMRQWISRMCDEKVVGGKGYSYDQLWKIQAEYYAKDMKALVAIRAQSEIFLEDNERHTDNQRRKDRFRDQLSNQKALISLTRPDMRSLDEGPYREARRVGSGRIYDTSSDLASLPSITSLDSPGSKAMVLYDDRQRRRRNSDPENMIARVDRYECQIKALKRARNGGPYDDLDATDGNQSPEGPSRSRPRRRVRRQRQTSSERDRRGRPASRLPEYDDLQYEVDSPRGDMPREASRERTRPFRGQRASKMPGQTRVRNAPTTSSSMVPYQKPGKPLWDYDRIPAHQVPDRLQLPWYWYSQLDTMPGFWVNPWQRRRPGTDSFLHRATILFREALKEKTNSRVLQYVPWTHDIYRQAKEHLDAGKCTVVPYGPTRTEDSHSFQPVNEQKFVAFSGALLTPIFMLAHNEYRNRPPGGLNKLHNDQDICELMVLDSWLTQASRDPAISKGKATLDVNAPELIDRVMFDEQTNIEAMDWSSDDEGLQQIEEHAQNINVWIPAFLDLSEAEHLFLLVAIYRTIRTVHCLLHGPDSSRALSILRLNPAVYMA